MSRILVATFALFFPRRHRGAPRPSPLHEIPISRDPARPSSQLYQWDYPKEPYWQKRQRENRQRMERASEQKLREFPGRVPTEGHSLRPYGLKESLLQ